MYKFVCYLDEKISGGHDVLAAGDSNHPGDQVPPAEHTASSKLLFI